ncbi:hypothetical protein CVT24_004238 [Panaeolus cyanescens]|uniref:CCHC-type domain-containing protein n=1 Tax=Panaeolus cyanescens TaxID=181874 RepID=A0A409VCG3_9AGAR|nr:hypothetical protein CVT24_004238 [Panaeolus cyanescens]
MTRATNFGIKRKYVQAGFGQEDAPAEPTNQAGPSTIQASEADTSSAPVENPPAKKKRKRTPKSQRDYYVPKEPMKPKGKGKANEGGEENGEEEQTEAGDKPAMTKAEKKKKKFKDFVERKEKASEARRLKRIKDKMSSTTCFACREKGHAAKDCPTTQKADEDELGHKVQKGVGICYRCGSDRHSLSRCKKPANPNDPFPYASCFVCEGKGHLASACPQNKSKGVYPNGGSCKLCGQTTHLAKDCDVRKKGVDPIAVFGTGREAGADEDDFHTLKRRTIEVDHEVKQADKLKNLMEIKTGVHSGIVKAFGAVAAQTTKKKVTQLCIEYCVQRYSSERAALGFPKPFSPSFVPSLPGDNVPRSENNLWDRLSRKKEKTTALVLAAIRAGFNAIDTACQPKHYREDLVGAALAELQEKEGLKRENLFLQTKYTPISGQDKSKPLPYNPSNPISTQILTSCQKSLSNLHTTYIDSYLLHSPLPTLNETLEAWSTLMQLQDEGKVKMIGISNVYEVKILAALQKLRKVQVVQNRWYEGNGWDQAVFNYCKEHGIMYQSFWTLTGSPSLLSHPRLRTIASASNITPEQAVYKLAQDAGVVPLSGTTNQEHMYEDLAIETLSLSKDVGSEIQEINSLIFGV